MSSEIFILFLVMEKLGSWWSVYVSTLEWLLYLEWGSHVHIETLPEAELLYTKHERNVNPSTAHWLASFPLCFPSQKRSF